LLVFHFTHVHNFFLGQVDQLDKVLSVLKDEVVEVIGEDLVPQDTSDYLLGFYLKIIALSTARKRRATVQIWSKRLFPYTA
jgi:hypothetical protein